jgi:hypothetical protein
MSIHPVQGTGPANETQFADANVRPWPPRSSAPAAAGSSQLNSEVAPKQELRNPQNESASREMPQDVVQVQRDGGTNGEIVIRYLDRSGDVILQVPSAQVLAMTRTIDENFQQEAKARSAAVGTTQAGSEGGKTHGH